jgi:hypothetical protein
MLIHLWTLVFAFISTVAALSSAAMGADRFMPKWTFTEVLNKYDAVVVARPGDSATTSEVDQKVSKTSQYVVLDLLKGDESLSGKDVVARTLPGVADGELLLLVGMRDKPSDELHWCVAMSVTQAYLKHVLTISKLEKTGAPRLAFLQPLMEHADKSVAANAHLEFVVATEEAFSTACNKLDRSKIRQWLSEPDISADRQRLYLAMLAQCGNDADGEWLHEVLTAGEAPKSLDIWLGSYLALKGEAGLPLVHRRYLANPNATEVELYSAILALRYIRDLPNSRISKASLIQSFRLVLGNIKLADLVVLDLTHLEDWESLDRLVELFNEPDAKWLRIPVVHFVQACPTPLAQERLKELTQLDPTTVWRAKTFPMRAFETRKPVTLRRHYRGKSVSGC